MKEINLTKGYKTIIDDDDYARVSCLKWCASETGSGHVYARTSINKKTTSMHRFIMGLQRGDQREVDHVDGDTLNNQRSNLRICTRAQNSANTKKSGGCASPFKGVQRGMSGWQVAICANGEKHYFGEHATQIAAAAIYNREARRLFGEFAKVNNLPCENEVLAIIDQVQELKNQISALEKSLLLIDQRQEQCA